MFFLGGVTDICCFAFALYIERLNTVSNFRENSHDRKISPKNSEKSLRFVKDLTTKVQLSYTKRF